jgi:two-component system response regulator NreC
MSTHNEFEPNTAAAKRGVKRLLIVDGQPLMSRGLASLINREADLVCCGQARSMEEAQQAVAAQKPDLVLLELRLGKEDGLHCLKVLKSRFSDLRILVLSELDEKVYAIRAFRAGAAGYVMKQEAAAAVLEAIRTVLRGELYGGPQLVALAMRWVLGDCSAGHSPKLDLLTDRELHVFKALAAGKTGREIAAQLGLSPRTIETHRAHIRHKLGLPGKKDLVRCADQWLREQGGSPLEPAHLAPPPGSSPQLRPTA